MKILVVDDEVNARVMLQQMATCMGHEAVLARNGREAVELFAAESPDIVLMDVMMPEMDGYQATAKIRELPTDKWVPVVYLSALDRNMNLLKGLEAGGDDYIGKPINLAELQAKIRALQRVGELQASLAKKRKLLESYYRQAEEEARIGSYIMNRLTSTEGLQDEAVQHWSRPLHHFSGDLMAAARTPANALHVLLADAVGHGLPAALNVLPLADTFYDMTARGFSLASIIGAMDSKIKQMMPLDRFVAATLLSIDEAGGEVELWNGGNPPPTFFGASGNFTVLERGRQLPLGLLQGEADTRPEVITLAEAGQLVLGSDGLCEAQAADGSYLDADRMRTIAAGVAPERRLDSICSGFEAHLGGESPQDDVSIMLVNVGSRAAEPAMPAAAAVRREAAPSVSGGSDAPGWRVQLRFGARELKTLDVIPFLTGLVEKLETSSDHRRQIFMILSELVSNALEHGLLKLESSMKSTAAGFEAYMAERLRRLDALREGAIEVTLERVTFEQSAAIRIHVRDSGKGFDHAAPDSMGDAEASQLHGRGILLVRSLSHHVQYLGHGNEVVCHYCL